MRERNKDRQIEIKERREEIKERETEWKKGGKKSKKQRQEEIKQRHKERQEEIKETKAERNQRKAGRNQRKKNRKQERQEEIKERKTERKKGSKKSKKETESKKGRKKSKKQRKKVKKAGRNQRNRQKEKRAGSNQRKKEKEKSRIIHTSWMRLMTLPFSMLQMKKPFLAVEHAIQPRSLGAHDMWYVIDDALIAGWGHHLLHTIKVTPTGDMQGHHVCHITDAVSDQVITCCTQSRSHLQVTCKVTMHAKWNCTSKYFKPDFHASMHVCEWVGWVDEWVSERASEWVSEWVCVCMSVCVCVEWGWVNNRCTLMHQYTWMCWGRQDLTLVPPCSSPPPTPQTPWPSAPFPSSCSSQGGDSF